MEALTKTGKIIIQGSKITLKRMGIVGFLAEITSIVLFPFYFIMQTNTGNQIDINKIEKVEYSFGTKHLTRPRMKIYYGKSPRYVIFKRPFTNYENAGFELEKAITELEKLKVKIIKI